MYEEVYDYGDAGTMAVNDNEEVYDYEAAGTVAVDGDEEVNDYEVASADDDPTYMEIVDGTIELEPNEAS